MKNKAVIVGLIVAGGALALLVVAACGGALFFAYRTTGTDLSPRIDELLTAIDRDTFDALYATETTAEFQKATTKEAWHEIGQRIKTRLGSLKSKSLTQFHVQSFNANTQADVAYNATFEHGTGSIKARFKKSGNRWLILAFHVDSAEFRKDATVGKCPHCGEPHTADARFCSKCGKPLAN